MTELRLQYCLSNGIELGIDEAGRGPLFGRLYVAGVVLPKEPILFQSNTKIRDSKKIKSHRKMGELSTFIKENALAWSITYIEHDVIDEINIRQAVFRGMRFIIRDILSKLSTTEKTLILIDGNDFVPESGEYENVPFITVEKGDNTFMSIACASILAKYARDEYILELCKEHPELVEKYGLNTNMGYATKKHIDGIREYGISQWHRTTFHVKSLA